MDALQSEIQHWLKVWKQNWRIHDGAATEGKAGRRKVEASTEGTGGATLKS